MQIKQLTEPKSLYLAWQAPEHLNNRFRWAVALITPSESSATLRYLLSDKEEFKKLNSDHTVDELKSLGFVGYPAFRLSSIVYTEGVIEALRRRLPPRSRPDYGKYLLSIGFAPGVEPSDLSLLTYTEAKLPSDGFSVVDPLDPDQHDADVLVELAGSRYYLKHSPGDKAGLPVRLQPEPTNLHDSNAIQVFVEDMLLGYINRLQAPTIGHWIKARELHTSLHRANGSPDRPKIYVLLRVRSRNGLHRAA